MISSPIGRPSELTDEVKARLLQAVPLVIVPNQVAAYAKVPKSSLKNWLKRGESDLNEHIDSTYAQFWAEFKAIQAQVVREHIALLRTCPKNYGALTWILEKCFREDFGADSEEMRELRDLFKLILPLLGKGEATNGSKEAQELHQEGN